VFILERKASSDVQLRAITAMSIASLHYNYGLHIAEADNKVYTVSLPCFHRAIAHFCHGHLPLIRHRSRPRIPETKHPSMYSPEGTENSML